MYTDKKRISFPTSTMDIPLERFIAYHDLPIESRVNVEVVLDHFTELNRDEIKRMDVKSAETIMVGITNALGRSQNQFYKKIKIDGTEFGAIPNLDDMSFGEYIDLCEKMDDIHQWGRAMQVMYRPITEKRKVAGVERYSIEPYHGTNDELEQFWLRQPCAYPLGVYDFFLTLGEQLLIATEHYSTRQ